MCEEYNDCLEFNEDESIYYDYGEGFEDDWKKPETESEESEEDSMNEEEVSFTALNKKDVRTEEIDEYLNGENK